MRSLRTRLLLLVTLLLLGAVVAIGFATRRVTESEFRRFQTSNDRRLARELTVELAEHFDRQQWNGVDTIVQRLASRTRRGVLVTTPEWRLLSAAPALWQNAAVRRNAGSRGVAIEAGRGTQRLRLVLRGDGEPVLADGRLVARLYLLPAPPAAADPGSTFLSEINRRTILVITLVAATGLALAWSIARRLTIPIEALTRAAERAAAGDLSVRVPAANDDEIGRLSRAFNGMVTALERDDRMQRQTTSDIAHELRTPLTNLRCELEAAQDGLRPFDKELITSLHDETLRLARLIDDLQELSLAESGQLRLDRAAHSCSELVQRAAANFQQRLRQSGIGLITDIAPDGAVNVDADRIVQVIRILLTNALEHSPEGTEIVITARRNEIEVRDAGEGISAEHLPLVFERFYRADVARSRKRGGSGLGLAIARSLVEAHGGTIRVESLHGRGATFTITMPPA